MDYTSTNVIHNDPASVSTNPASRNDFFAVDNPTYKTAGPGEYPLGHIEDTPRV